MIKMKRVKIIFISLIVFFGFYITVNAASGVLTVNSEKVKEGDSFKTTVTINSAAAWNIHVSASGPVKDCTINEVGVTDDGTDTDKVFNTTCTATGEGKITIKLEGDITSAIDETAVDISSTKVVSVLAKEKNSNNGGNSIISNPETRTPILIVIFILLVASITFIVRKNISNKN